MFDRRRFLTSCIGAAGGLLVPSVYANSTLPEKRELSFYNIHTDERLSILYWESGCYLSDAMDEANHFLRDHRTGDIYPVDRHLLDMLHAIQQRLETNKPFYVVSGYRSPETNSMLRSKSNAVAKNSFHMKGQAIDIRIPYGDIDHLYKAAISLNQGGVGYYGKSGFVHVDTGPRRMW